MRLTDQSSERASKRAATPLRDARRVQHARVFSVRGGCGARASRARHLEPWHAARGAGPPPRRAFLALPMASSPRETNARRRVSLRAVTRRAKRATPLRPRAFSARRRPCAATGKHHPSVNLPPCAFRAVRKARTAFRIRAPPARRGFLVVGRGGQSRASTPWRTASSWTTGRGTRWTRSRATWFSARRASRASSCYVCPPTRERARGAKRSFHVPPRVAVRRRASTRAARVCGTRPSVPPTPNTPAHVPVLGAVLRPGVRRRGVARGGREGGGDAPPVRCGTFSAAGGDAEVRSRLSSRTTQTPRTPRGRCGARGRTDKGVHGLAQTVSFTVADDLEKESREAEKKGA